MARETTTTPELEKIVTTSYIASRKVEPKPNENWEPQIATCSGKQHRFSSDSGNYNTNSDSAGSAKNNNNVAKKNNKNVAPLSLEIISSPKKQQLVEFSSNLHLDAPLACSTKIYEESFTSKYGGPSTSKKLQISIVKVQETEVKKHTVQKTFVKNEGSEQSFAYSEDVSNLLDPEPSSNPEINDMTETLTNFSEMPSQRDFLGDDGPSTLVDENQNQAENKKEENKKEEDKDEVPSKLELQTAKLTKEKVQQDEIMSQALKALDFCLNSREFCGSVEQVAAERAYLVAYVKHKVIKNELAKLYEEAEEVKNKGTIVISNATFHTKRTCHSPEHKDYTQYFVCIGVCGTEVKASECTVKTIDNTITFTDMNLVFDDIPTHFQITLNLYAIKIKNSLRQFSHESKYHLNKDSKKKGKCLSPKAIYNFTRDISRLSLRGASSQKRKPSFDMFASVHLTIGDLQKPQRGSKYNVIVTSDFLTKKVELDMKGKINLVDTHAGFLNLGYELGGAIVWERRWCELQGFIFKFYQEPTVQNREEADLRYCVTNYVTRADRELCPRPKTLMMELVRKDQEPRSRNRTIERYFLQADTLRELNHWQRKLNSVICTLKNWNNMKISLLCDNNCNRVHGG